MRNLQRNLRKLYYATPLGTESILDDYGNDTLEIRTAYSEVKSMGANVSTNVGQEAVNTFGAVTDYNRTITYTGQECPLVKGSIVWFGADPTGAHNYVVVKVADSKNGYLVALREVSDRG